MNKTKREAWSGPLELIDAKFILEGEIPNSLFGHIPLNRRKLVSFQWKDSTLIRQKQNVNENDWSHAGLGFFTKASDSTLFSEYREKLTTVF